MLADVRQLRKVMAEPVVPRSGLGKAHNDASREAYREAGRALARQRGAVRPGGVSKQRMGRWLGNSLLAAGVLLLTLAGVSGRR